MNFRIDYAVNGDYERLDREIQNLLFNKFSCLNLSSKYDLICGCEYRFRTASSLVDIMAAAHLAVHNSGKAYSYTVIKQKGLSPAARIENRLDPVPA